MVVSTVQTKEYHLLTIDDFVLPPIELTQVRFFLLFTDFVLNWIYVDVPVVFKFNRR